MIRGVSNKNKIEFIRSVISLKIKETNYRSVNAACIALSFKLQNKLSSATLFKALNGEFTKRTVGILKNAGWFTWDEYDNSVLSNKETEPNPYYQPQSKPKTQSYSTDFTTYKEGYDDGYKKGYHAGVAMTMASTISGFSQSKPTNSLPTEKLKNLFNLNLGTGAAAGEMVAARRAAGKVLAAWIKDQFKQDVEIELK